MSNEEASAALAAEVEAMHDALATLQARFTLGVGFGLGRTTILSAEP